MYTIHKGLIGSMCIVNFLMQYAKVSFIGSAYGILICNVSRAFRTLSVILKWSLRRKRSRSGCLKPGTLGKFRELWEIC